MTAPDLPHVSPVFTIEKDWIDFNGHMNMACYPALFDRAIVDMYSALGMGLNYARSRRLTTYTAEIHLRYVRELHLHDRVHATYQLIDHDEKRLHGFQELRHSDGWLAATCEVMTLHIDMGHIDMPAPKVAPFPPDIQATIDAMRSAHSSLPVPQAAGVKIGIKRRQGAGGPRQ